MKKKWKPKIGDRYFFIEADWAKVTCGSSHWHHLSSFKNWCPLGIYRTKKDAEKAIKKIKKMVKSL